MDDVDVVVRALMGVAAGPGHRQAAALVDRPPSTMRDRIRRAHRNREAVRSVATRLPEALDPLAHPLDPTATTLSDMLDAVGGAAMAATLRLEPSRGGTLQHILLITRAGILAPRLRLPT